MPCPAQHRRGPVASQFSPVGAVSQVTLTQSSLLGAGEALSAPVRARLLPLSSSASLSPVPTDWLDGGPTATLRFDGSLRGLTGCSVESHSSYDLLQQRNSEHNRQREKARGWSPVGDRSQVPGSSPVESHGTGFISRATNAKC